MRDLHEPQVPHDEALFGFQAAADLPEEERELFHLVWYLGMQQDEASGLLGCSVRTVKRRWESAKSLLSAAVRGHPLA